MYYEYDKEEETFTLHNKYVSSITAWYYKLCKLHQVQMNCDYCDRPVLQLYRFSKPDFVECPDCK